MGTDGVELGNIEKVAIVGSRDYPYLEDVYEYVNRLPDGTVVVSGGAPGVDKCAEDTAKSRGLEVISFRPDWKKYPYTTFRYYAYRARNQQIVDEADVIVAFWDLVSTGTRDTLRKALKAQKPSTIFCPRSQGNPFCYSEEEVEEWVK